MTFNPQPPQQPQQQPTLTQQAQQALADIYGRLASLRTVFEKCKSTHSLLNFEAERRYAYFHIEKNTQAQLAKGNAYSLGNCSLDSIEFAFLLSASMDLSLNPQDGLGYLIPRLNVQKTFLEAYFEPSYKGFKRMALRSGAINSVTVELVHQKDTFEFIDRVSKPKHILDPFDTNRGKLRGGYCLAKLSDNSFICTPMSLSAIDRARASSNSESLWATQYNAMVAKTIVRHAYKHDWPIDSTQLGIIEHASDKMAPEELADGAAVNADAGHVFDQSSYDFKTEN